MFQVFTLPLNKQQLDKDLEYVILSTALKKQCTKQLNCYLLNLLQNWWGFFTSKFSYILESVFVKLYNIRFASCQCVISIHWKDGVSIDCNNHQLVILIEFTCFWGNLFHFISKIKYSFISNPTGPLILVV